MQFKRGPFIAEWSSVARHTLKVLGCEQFFFFILEHALKNFGACTEHRLQVVTNKGGPA